jgi:hypothetical protein
MKLAAVFFASLVLLSADDAPKKEADGRKAAHMG